MSLVEACIPNSASRSIGAPGSRHPLGRNQDMSVVFASQFRPKYVRGGLAPWQERRAKEILCANLDGRMPLNEVARECRLSVSHFSRAFRRSTGAAPHNWLLTRRVDLAKEKLRDDRLSLLDVALACGFADQSHLTRVFTRMVGVSPGAWRRALDQ